MFCLKKQLKEARETKEIQAAAQPVPKEFIINKSGLELVKHFESFFADAYLDPVGVATIGYGRIIYPDGNRVELGQYCTQEQADEWLTEDLEKEGAHYVRAWIKVKLSSNQFSALTSFTFNRGAGRFKERLVDMINAYSFELAMDKLLSYDWAIDRETKKPVVLEGLARRRAAERLLFLDKDWTPLKDSNNWREIYESIK